MGPLLSSKQGQLRLRSMQSLVRTQASTPRLIFVRTNPSTSAGHTHIKKSAAASLLRQCPSCWSCENPAKPACPLSLWFGHSEDGPSIVHLSLPSLVQARRDPPHLVGTLEGPL